MSPPLGWRPGLSRRHFAVAGVAGVLLLGAGTAVTHAAFTDSASADLGVVGGAYDIALVDADGHVVQGYPEPLVVDHVVAGPDGSSTVEVGVVTTTTVTGPKTLSLVNARPEPLPSDPGMPGPGADPFDVVLFTVTVDGRVVADAVPAAGLEPVLLADWETDVPRTVQVTARLPEALGNPYYAGRTMILGLQFDGSTS